jgi:hypothetical protein
MRLTMRRPRRLSFLSLGLIAVLLQVIAPGWAAIAMARQMDPLAQTIICSVEHVPADEPGKARHSQHAVCPICHIAAATHFVVLTASSVVVPPRTDDIVRHRHAEIAAPRGPPALRTRAREPPTFS